ncbi:MAG: GntR family transcriptional regulator [Desulfobacula sp.]|nr:GntR family transcriptional regulator [Desulfobacula sp.]
MQPEEKGEKMLKREKLSDKLADIYGNKIIKNELKSGDLIIETQISKEWGVSRSPVRDALHVLERKKLVRKNKSGSYTVLELTIDYLKNFHEMVNMFYQFSILKATKKQTEDELAYLLGLVKKIEISVEKKDYDTYVSSISNFGMMMLKIADNFLIEEFASELKSAQERIQYYAISLSPSHLNDTSLQIRKVYEHLSNNDPQKAAKAFHCFLNAIGDTFPDEPAGDR